MTGSVGIETIFPRRDVRMEKIVIVRWRLKESEVERVLLLLPELA